MCESVNYPGYEDDEEYGIEEEIRRPSGLGSPASAGEFRKVRYYSQQFDCEVISPFGI